MLNMAKFSIEKIAIKDMARNRSNFMAKFEIWQYVLSRFPAITAMAIFC
jgi:hypothetical protein